MHPYHIHNAAANDVAYCKNTWERDRKATWSEGRGLIMICDPSPLSGQVIEYQSTAKVASVARRDNKYYRICTSLTRLVFVQRLQ